LARAFIIGLFFTIVVIGVIVKIPYVVIPFLISFCIAYICNPALNWLQNKTILPRSILSISIALILTITFIYLIILLTPLIYSQIYILIGKIPVYKNYALEYTMPYILGKLHQIDPGIANSAKEVINQCINSLFGVFMSMAYDLWDYTIATINALVMMILIPIILFYFLRDWNKMTNSFYQLFPKKLQHFVQITFADINRVLSGYLRGQLLVCVIWIIYYYVGLKAIGLDLALILAVISGLTVMVPLIGPFISIVISLTVGYFTFGASIELSYIIALYILGNIADGSIVTPKIIGDSIGLHPLWIMFAVLLLGFIGGPLCILLAIPIAGIISVIIKSLKNEYKKSDLYNK